MPKIELKTEINAEKHIIFDLSRSIDLHKISTEHTNEEAIAGKMSGLIGMNDSVTWRAKHFGVYQKSTSKITEFERPNYFVDEMQKELLRNLNMNIILQNLMAELIIASIFLITITFL